MGNKMNKRGQLTLWIVIGLLLIVSMVLFFTLNQGPRIGLQEEFNPKSYIEKCARGVVNEATDIMLPQGGFISPRNYKMYERKNVAYLCENIGNYEACINQHPTYIDDIKKEIISYSRQRIDQCFNEVKAEIENRNGALTMGEMTLSVELAPARVFMNINRKLTIIKGEETSNLEDFRIVIINPIYDLANVAIEIANQEAKYCYFESTGYMLLYPQFLIERDIMSDSTKIYSITDKNSNKELNIAIRSCAIPPGI